jgi:hypothetical protein
MRVNWAGPGPSGVAMRKIYSIEPITLGTADRAYPLIRAVAPTVALEEWRQFCQGAASPLAADERASRREQAVLAIDSRKHVKGLCIYSIGEHWFYGRLLDIPIFIAASAADARGVGAELLQFLQAVCNRSICSGARFWTMGAEAWRLRLSEEEIRRTDHGVFVPALANFAQMENAESALMRAGLALIDRLSR